MAGGSGSLFDKIQDYFSNLTNLDQQISTTESNIRGADSEDLTSLLNTLQGANSDDLTSLLDGLQGTGPVDLTVLRDALVGSGAYSLTELRDLLNSLDVGQTNKASLAYGQDTVGTGGTSTSLNGGTSLNVPDNFGVRVKALSGNGGNVYVGDSAVGTSGFELTPNSGALLYVTDISLIYVYSGTAGWGVSWIIEQ